MGFWTSFFCSLPLLFIISILLPVTISMPSIDPIVSGGMRAHCVRLHPGDDLVPCLLEAAKQAIASSPSGSSSSSTVGSAFVLTCVGSLEEVTLRMASADAQTNADDGSNSTNNNHIKTWKERFEITSLVGTLTGTSKHLHMSISDKDGHTFGGHVMSGRVFTTVELVLGTADGVIFDRQPDPDTGFTELVVSKAEIEE
jgi:predicted DNA-binding protein with PD1-like motif